MVEMSLNNHQESETSEPLIIIYSIVTCLLVGVHLLSLMISRYVYVLLEASTSSNQGSFIYLDFFINITWFLSTGVGSISEIRRTQNLYFMRLIYI